MNKLPSKTTGLLIPAPDSVLKLVETFAHNLDFFKSSEYNEAQLRKEFLDPFFKNLGWDMDNTAGLAPQYRDVIHEASIKIGGINKAPDYAFSIHGQWKFFLEAKKPSVNVKDDTNPAYQLRRYGWSAKLPVSILTDFEEFAVYDCRIRPKQTDRPATARLSYFKFTDYTEKWDELQSIFSKDAILKGSFDKYTTDSRRHRGTETVDDAFLEEIERWRDLLARNIALRNPSLTVRDLNFAVQKTIDRLIFLRICEDRGTEDYKRLAAIQNGTNTYARLLELFHQADDRYNSGLFHFRDEKGRAGRDTLTPELKIDDTVLKDIVQHLYYPDSPYEFSVLPADILGSVYERFLGKTIRLTAGHQAKIEDKPEVRKAGGVYYTPTYIVDYIVKNTLGRILDGPDPENPKPITVSKAAKLKVLDPACGSGSFLIVAYQYLLDWHLRQYSIDPTSNELEPGKIKRHSRGKNSKLYQARDGAWKLTTAERKRILLNNIHGVDIDSQAVEVTKLSLLLKVIEGETDQVRQRDWIKERQRILPDLVDNIQCGNSLIGPDFYNQEQMLLLDEETQYRINVFDWETAFPQVFQQGGFDCVIGNPPYIPIEVLTAEEKNYLTTEHLELSRKYDSSVIFILSLLKRIKATGKLSYISSVTWQTGKNYVALRKTLFKSFGLELLINLPFDVFDNVFVDTCVYVVSGRPTNSYQIFNYPKKIRVCSLDDAKLKVVPISLIDKEEWKVIINPEASSILNRLVTDYSMRLGDISISTQGLSASRYDLADHLNDEFKYPFLKSGQVYRYELHKNVVQFTSLENKKTLEQFYNYGQKIFIRRVISRADRLLATLVSEFLITKKDLNPFRITCTKLKSEYILGLLNSKLISYLYVNTSSIATKDDFRQTTLSELRDLPIRPIDFDKPDDVALHDKMVGLVERMLELHKKKATKKNPNILKQLETQIAATDRQIDRLVYHLYALTDKEIALVEGKAK